MPNRSYRKVLRIASTSDGRYVPVDENYGRYNGNRPNAGAIDTTYLHPHMDGHNKPHGKPLLVPHHNMPAVNLIRYRDYKIPEKCKHTNIE